MDFSLEGFRIISDASDYVTKAFDKLELVHERVLAISCSALIKAVIKTC
ncbi:hypothetical protein ACU8KH_01638 [Lachancea thermotolerans]